EAAQYIETIPKRGYRFVANVKDVRDEREGLVLAPPAEMRVINGREKETDNSESESELRLALIEPGVLSLQSKPSASRWRRLAIWPALGLALGVTIWAMFFHLAKESPAPILNIVPFTSFPGRETQAAFSPDGNQIAFVWDGGKGDNPDIYVKL